jgi:hypothetical protein
MTATTLARGVVDDAYRADGALCVAATKRQGGSLGRVEETRGTERCTAT